jgi:hypothetical protein
VIGSQHAFAGSEGACGITAGVINKAIVKWMKRDHKKHWQFIAGLKPATIFLEGSSVKGIWNY